MNRPSCLAVIPARGGSRRIPRKNVRPFFGKPIIAYSIDVARLTCLFKKIIVSSDDLEIGQVALNYGATFATRPPYLAFDQVGTQEVTKYVLEEELAEGREYAYCCCIYPCAPTLNGGSLTAGYNNIRTCSMGILPYRYVGIPGWYYWGRAIDFIENPAIGPKDWVDAPKPTAGAKERWIDINEESDWSRAEEMYAKLTAEGAAA